MREPGVRPVRIGRFRITEPRSPTRHEARSISSSPNDNAPSPRRPGLRRRLFWICSVALVVTGIGLFLATRSFVLEAIARPIITATVGGEIEIGRVRWIGLTRLEVRDLTIRAPGWPGASGEVISIDRAGILLDADALKRGAFLVDRVEVEGMVVRIAEDSAEPGRFSVLSLKPEIGDDGGSPPRRIDVTDFELQMGVDRDGTWERTGRLALAGDLRSEPGALGVYGFEFVTGDGIGSRSVLKGELDTDSLAFNASIDDLEVNTNLLGLMPMELRRVAQAMALQGHVDRIETAWDGNRDLYAAIELAEANLVLPDLAEDTTWSRIDDGEVTLSDTAPIMEVRSGRLALIDDRITLEDFMGRLRSDHPDTDDIPVILDFEMDFAPVLEERLDWSRSREVATRVLSVAPFSLILSVPDFNIRGDGEGIVLPTAAATTIAQFGVEEWLLDLEVFITRDLPTRAEDGTMTAAAARTDGQVRVRDGVGRYSRFPYPLQNVQAQIEFDDQRVDILTLTGNGPEGGTLSAMGSIIDPGPAAEIDVRLHGSDIPADASFRSALDGWRLRTWDRFFDRRAERQLRELGLLPDKASVARARRELTAVLERLARETDLPEAERTRLSEESRRLRRVVDAGPFELGGRFGFDLTVTSEAGVGKPVDLTGSILITEGDVILEDFPLPTQVKDSEIILERDLIRLGSGISITTPDGGTGLIRGSIATDTDEAEGTADIRPDISFAAIDVAISPALLAALPPGDEDRPENPDDWPGRWDSEASLAMQALGIQGRIDLEGGWLAQADGDPELSFDAILEDGSITPNLELEEFFARAGFIWPEGFTLDGCEARIHLDDSILRLDSFTGRRGAGVVTADGFLSRMDEARAIQVAFRDIELEEYLLDLITDGTRDEARRLWTRFRPRGTFDADLDWSRSADDSTSSLVVARPGLTTLDMDGEDVRFDVRSGEIRIEPERIGFESMYVVLAGPGIEYGEVLVDGAYGRSSDGRELALRGEVSDGRFESPVLSVLLDLAGADRVRESWLELEPSGRFDAGFEYRVLADLTNVYAIDVVPSSVSANLQGERVHAAFDSGMIVITPGRIDVENVAATIPAPGTIDLDATILIDDMVRVQAALAYDLEEMPAGTHAYFPAPLAAGFSAVEFRTEGPFVLSEGLIDGRWPPDAPIEEPESYRFDAAIEFVDAAFVAGATFDEFSGHARLDLESVMGEEGRLVSRLEAPVRGRSLKAQDRHVDRPRGTLVMNGDDRLVIDDLSGDVAGGRVVGEVEIDLEESTWGLALDLEDASLQELSRAHDAPPTEGTIGRVLAGVELTGRLGDPSSKRGRGRLIVEEGEMTNSPLTLSIVQLSQLMLPISNNLEFAEIAFTVDGDRMVFDEFELGSPTLRLEGGGEMSLADWELALKLSPKGTLPVISDLISGMTGTLFAINVKGTLDEPEASLEPLPLLGSPARIRDPDTPPAREPDQPPSPETGTGAETG